MRGKLVLLLGLTNAARIIPAHAGQTSLFSVSSILTSDHPRACGANVDLGYDGGASVGSSPRMRGKLRHAGGLPASERIIPAHAGQTTIFSFNSARWSDHPRACGANGVWGVFNIRGHGSSPRMRGKLFHNCSVLCFVRIIPAHAGQTMVAGRHSTPSTDHPRACGANAWRRDCRRAIYGSSPRMRGKPEHRHPGHGHRRIIPAHAGQTTTVLTVHSMT